MARLSAPLRCTLSEINSESLACRWAHLAVNTRAKSQKSQIPTISNTCWNRAISWSWKHSTCWTKHAKVTHGKTKIWQSILTVLSQHYPALKLKIVATLKILGIHLSSLKILIFYIVPMTLVPLDWTVWHATWINMVYSSKSTSLNAPKAPKFCPRSCNRWLVGASAPIGLSGPHFPLVFQCIRVCDYLLYWDILRHCKFCSRTVKDYKYIDGFSWMSFLDIG